MFELPLHPAVVHIPIGLAIVLPILTLLFLFLFYKNKLTKISWIFIFILQLFITAGGYVAIETGEDEEDRVEKVVGHDLIEEHEHKAEDFMKISFVTLAVTAIPFFITKAPILGAVFVANIAMQSLSLFYIVQTGEMGGHIVYEHQAPKAYLQESFEKSEDN